MSSCAAVLSHPSEKNVVDGLQNDREDKNHGQICIVWPSRMLQSIKRSHGIVNDIDKCDL